MDKTITIDQLDSTNLADVSIIILRVQVNQELIVADRYPSKIRKKLINQNEDSGDLCIFESIHVLDKNSEEFLDTRQAILTVREKVKNSESLGFKMTVPDPVISV